jgi:putative nucleotidyltransferase with HDIG domain
MKKVLKAKLLVIEESVSNVDSMESKLAKLKFENLAVIRPVEALDFVRKNYFDLIFYLQPEFNYENIQLVKKIVELFLDIPILLVSQNIQPALMRLAIQYGAYDFINEPVKIKTIPAIIARNIERKNVTRQNLMKKQSEILMKAIKALIAAMEAKDERTSGHSMRVVRYAKIMADCLDLSHEDRFVLKLSAALHDIGKIGLPDRILKESSSLHELDYGFIKGHPEVGSNIVGRIDELREVAAVIKHHHERFDGTGYPDGLKGEVIPFLSRILAIVDAYESLTSDRIYRKGLSPLEALEELKDNAGTQFDPFLVKIFIEQLGNSKQKIEALREPYLLADEKI